MNSLFNTYNYHKRFSVNYTSITEVSLCIEEADHRIHTWVYVGCMCVRYNASVILEPASDLLSYTRVPLVSSVKRTKPK